MRQGDNGPRAPDLRGMGTMLRDSMIASTSFSKIEFSRPLVVNKTQEFPRGIDLVMVIS